MDVSDTKLMNALGQDVYSANITEESGIIPGFIGPYEQKAKATLVFDTSLKGIDSLIVGGNKTDYHYTGFNMERDFKEVKYLDLSKILDGGICPKCGNKTIKMSRGIEVGNIFQLGTKYTKAMKMTYLDANGKTQNPIMGCYGIGVGRLAASVCEARHDDYGPIWPISIAPWEIHLCCLRADDVEAKTFADDLYATMQKENMEVLYDDREVRPGVMFSDADLLGIPVRVIVSPRNLKESVVEVMTRTKSIQKKVPKEDVIAEVKALVNQLKSDLLS
jgi:prolyl-tRNA synthetase